MTQEIVIRVQSNGPNQYGLGKVVSPNVALFEDGFYNLTKEELETKLKAIRRAVVR